MKASLRLFDISINPCSNLPSFFNFFPRASAPFLVPRISFDLRIPSFFLLCCRFNFFFIEMESHRFDDSNEVASGGASNGGNPDARSDLPPFSFV